MNEVVDFLFSKDVIALMEREDIEPLPNYMTEVNGVTCVGAGFSFINLNADRWKIDMSMGGEDGFIDALCPIIMHETIHQCVGTKVFTGIDYTQEGEERVCLLMAGQYKIRIEV